MVTFDEACAALLARGPGRMIPDLERITRMAELMGDPQRAYPSIHVTGTNGKTSVSRMTTTLLAGVGLAAGTYISPHLQSPRERLSVAGRPISERRFAEVYTEILPLLDHVDGELDDPRDHVTYFEALTAMAYAWFADVPVDVGVFEVGMGGRWDATNLIRGEVAVLTTIDVDHRELGDTPVEIAGEKTGIIKPGATVVSGPQADDVMDVIRGAADEAGATLLVAGRDVEVMARSVALGGQLVTLRVAERTIGDVLLPLHGEHQASNAALALAAVAAFTPEGFSRMDDDLVREVFAAVSIPGRLETVATDPTVVLDGAHNPHGAVTAAKAIEEAFTFRNRVLVLACLGDKDLVGIVRAYKDLANHVVVTRAPSPRSATVEQMAAVAEEVWAGTGVIVEAAADVDEAMDKATGVAGDGDGVIVTGSLYTVGAARDRYLPLGTGNEPVPEVERDEDEEAAFQQALNEMLEGLDDED